MPSDLDITTQLRLHPLMAWYGVKRSVEGGNGKKLYVEVPAGIRNQTRLRLAGAGRRRDGEQGDLFVEIKIDRPKFFFLQKCLLALGSLGLGSVIVAKLSESVLRDVWLILGSLLVTFGLLMLCGMIQPEYSGKREMGLGAFVFLSTGPALLINGFEFDVNFTWTAAFGCATLGGIIGSLSLQSQSKFANLAAGIIAGNSTMAMIYHYTKQRESIWNFEIALLIALGAGVGLGLNWLLKRLW